MKLKSYIIAMNMTVAAAARQLGTTQQCLARACDGQRIPRKDLMQRIYDWSDGMVQPNDFYDLPPAAARCNGPAAVMDEVAA